MEGRGEGRKRYSQPSVKAQKSGGDSDKIEANTDVATENVSAVDWQ